MHKIEFCLVNKKNKITRGNEGHCVKQNKPDSTRVMRVYSNKWTVRRNTYLGENSIKERKGDGRDVNETSKGVNRI